MNAQRINIGRVYQEHAVPPGAQVRELKTCEICGRSFARKFAATEVYATYVACFTVMLSKPPLEVTATLRKDRGERFCGACKSRQLMPDVEAQIKYLIQLPETPTHSRPKLPVYDALIKPRQRRARRADRSDVAPGRHSSGAHAAGIGRGLHADPRPGRARAAEGARPADRAARAEHREAGPFGAV